MNINDFPAEILTTIYEMVVYDETVSSWAAPTSMKESYWDKPRKDYVLIDPNVDLHIRQRRKYAMTKVCAENLTSTATRLTTRHTRT